MQKAMDNRFISLIILSDSHVIMLLILKPLYYVKIISILIIGLLRMSDYRFGLVD